jgi:glyoxylase-like metal-dependent hydrolase (beta-lactamase superfamily II)/rhodanese-related sulfurtransferase
MSSAPTVAGVEDQGSALDVANLLAMIDAGRPLLVVDVRNEEEHASWRIEGCRPFQSVHVPYFEFLENPEEAIARVPIGTAPVAVVCAKGGSSDFVAGMLRDAGRAAQNVAGGMLAYGDHLHATRFALAEGDEGRLEIWQVNRRGRGCLSYVIRSGDEAAVIDPSRRTEFYQSFAEGLRARVTVVLDTHVHADHLSGGPAVARATGAKYLAPPEDATSPASRLCDGMTLRIGQSVIQVLATPGHTPESVCLLVEGKYLVSGDTLFARGIGRPDLGSDLGAWARQLYRTLQNTLSRLPNETVILPAHYSHTSEIGPDGTVSGSLGELRRTSPELQITSEAEFVAAMERAARPPPPSYPKIVRANWLREPVPEDLASEWEIGRNECAATRAAR